MGIRLVSSVYHLGSVSSMTDLTVTECSGRVHTPELACHPSVVDAGMDSSIPTPTPSGRLISPFRGSRQTVPSLGFGVHGGVHSSRVMPLAVCFHRKRPKPAVADHRRRSSSSSYVGNQCRYQRFRIGRGSSVDSMSNTLNAVHPRLRVIDDLRHNLRFAAMHSLVRPIHVAAHIRSVAVDDRAPGLDTTRPEHDPLPSPRGRIRSFNILVVTKHVFGTNCYTTVFEFEPTSGRQLLRHRT